MRSRLLWTSLAILAIFVLTSHAYINDAEDEEDSFWARRSRLVAASTARAGSAVRLSEMAEMSGTTSQSSELIRQFIPSEKQSTRSAGASVVCPDHKSFCPEDTTCCPLNNESDFGCCPSPNAVCCSDHIHCCPNGMTCDIEESMCQPADSSSAASRLLRKLPSTRIIKKTGIRTTTARHYCASSPAAERFQYSCPSGSSCCANEMLDGVFCCPHANGECCSANSGCCPHGMKCTDSGECKMQYHRIFAKPKPLLEATQEKSAAAIAIICDDNSECPGLGTCCPVRSTVGGAVESYRCCSLSQASCCGVEADFCCPSGHTCASGRRCERLSLAKFFTN